MASKKPTGAERVTTDSPTAGGTSGRARLQEMQAADARKAKQKKLFAIIGGLLALVLVAVAVMWGVSRSDHESAEQKAMKQSKDTSFIPTVTSIPASTFDKVGAGVTQAGAFTPISGGQTSIEDGKPRITYFGAEFCPYCAMERYSFVAALSRFGTFKGLAGDLSSGEEGALSNIQTMTFRNASYTSKYIALKTYETTDRDHNPLQKPSAADQQMFDQGNPKGGIPWISWGGQTQGVLPYDTTKFPVSKSNTEIANAMKDPNSDIAKMIIGSANVHSAEICKLTNNQPANVCNSAGVKAAAKNLAQ